MKDLMHDIVLIAHPRQTEEYGQRFYVRRSSLAETDVSALSDKQFDDFVMRELESIFPSKEPHQTVDGP